MNEPARSRMAILASGCLILFALYWYTDELSRGLLIASAGIIALSLGFQQWALATTRAYIWTGVALLILTLTANIERIAPPEDQFDLLVTYHYHRIVTVALVPALMSLFMRPGRAAGTMVIAGCMPMVIFAFARQQAAPADSSSTMNLLVWLCLGLIIVVGQIQNLVQPRRSGVAALGGSEITRRAVYLTALLALVSVLALPAGALVTDGMRWLYRNRIFRPPQDAAQGNFYLNLAAPPGGFMKNMRPVLSIRSPGPPGYLRQSVYRDLISGKWGQRPRGKDNFIITPEIDRRTFAINAVAFDMSSIPWRVQVLGVRWRTGANLPQHTGWLQVADPQELRINPDDNILWQNDVAPASFQFWPDAALTANPFEWIASPVGPAVPSRYNLHAVHEEPTDRDPTYRYISPEWRDDVASWVAGCEALTAAATPQEKMFAVAAYFHENFTYRLQGPPLRGRDELRAFMAERQGHCTLFASAATLMLRHAGIPARMVGGYLATELHPVTGEWVVRERDAHAWCEAYDAIADGWRRVEATPANGLPVDFPAPGALRAWLEAGVIGWRNLVELLRHANPLIWLADTGATAYLAIETFIVTPLGIATILIFTGGIVYLRIRRRRTKFHSDADRWRAEMIETMVRLERQHSSITGRRAENETWLEWESRTSPPSRLRELLATYQELRYRPGSDIPRMKAWIAQVRRFKLSG